MGKKHHQSGGAPVAQASGPAVEQQATEALAARRFRKARDLYKELCKQDRAKHLPGLIAANRGLAAELTEKGQVSEAAQVIAYLKTIAPATDLLGMEVQSAQRAKDWPRAIQLALDLWKTTGGAPAAQDRAAIANALVLAFPELEKPDGAPWPEALKSELAGILGTLRAVSEGRFEAAQDFLRPLPRASIFADWKLLAKGWVAFHAGDLGKAGEFFALLPAESVPGRVATAFQPFLRQTNFPDGVEREKAIVRTCQLAGDAALGPILARADQLWKMGKRVESFQEIRRTAVFPSERADLGGALSDFYGRAAYHLPDKDAGRYVFDGLLKRAENGTFKNEAEKRYLCRVLGGDALFEGASEQAEKWWRCYIEACPPNEPRTRQIASLLLAKVGESMARAGDGGPFGFLMRKPGLRGADGAERNLRESIEYDPKNLAAHLELLKVYEHRKKTSERNRLLDAMTKRFPDEKAVLFQTGRECIERGAYRKGLDALQRAYQLDRLDPEVAVALVGGYLDLGREYYEKRDLAKARPAFARAEEYSRGLPAGISLGLEFVHSRQAVLEMIFGDETQGRQLLAVSRTTAHSVPGMLMLAHTFHRVCERSHRLETPIWEELKTLDAATPADRAAVLAAFKLGRGMGERLNWTAELRYVEEQLAPVAGAAFAREEATELYEKLREDSAFRIFAHRLIKAGLQADSSDPRFQLFAEIAIGRPTELLDRAKITQMRAEAVRRRDDLTIKLADEVLRSIRDGPDFDPDFDGADDFDGDEDFDDLGGDEDPLQPLPDLEKIGEMKRAAQLLNDEEFAKFRQDSAKIIPPEIFDVLMGTRGKPGGAPQPKQNPGNSQLDLF